MPPQAAPASGQARGPAQAQTPDHITTTVQAFLAEHPHALVLEDGRTLFDLRESQMSLTSEHGRATLHLWSPDRNLVRRILAVTPRSHTLRLTVQRFGQPRPQTLELTAGLHLRTSSTRDSTRQRYLRLLDRVLLANFPGLIPEGFRSSRDLERSFGPGYARGTLVQGLDAWSVIAVNAAESQATIDGILTAGILWLQHCRDQAAARAAPALPRRARIYVGLRLILPRGTAATTLSRIAWLNPRLARYELFELDLTTEHLLGRDPSDHGNLTTRLLHAPNQPAALDRFAEAIPRVLAILPMGTPVLGLGLDTPPLLNSVVPSEAERPPSRSPPPSIQSQGVSGPIATRFQPNPLATKGTPACELRLRSNTELAFLLHGLEFARIRSSFIGQSFNRKLEVTVGSGPSETLLLPSTEDHLRELVRNLFDRRRASHGSRPRPGPHTSANTAANTGPTSTLNSTQDPLFRTDPERWLESTLRADLPALDPRLQPAPVYTEVPAFTGGGSNLDRGMLDLLAVTNDNRLAVIEIKAAEDLHLALQGLDYWIRIRHHHLAGTDPATGLGSLQQHGYFPQTRLGPDPPHLFLVAPALHIHPATETILRHFDPRVPWTLIALDERWRTHIKPIWRKRSTDAQPA